MNNEDLIKYRKLIMEDFNSQADIYKTDSEKAFIDYVIKLLDENEETSNIFRSYFSMTGIGNRKIQIDGFGFDDTDGTYILFCSKYDVDDEISTITQTEIDQYVRCMEAFIDNSLNMYIQKNAEFASEGKAIADDLLRYFNNGIILKFKFYIFTNCILSSRVKVLHNKKLFDKATEINVWDIERIYDSDANNREKEDIIIDVVEYMGDGLNCIKAFENESNEYCSYLAVIPGDLLAKIYDKYGSRLLEKNVRDFLTFSGRVNSGIRGTIKNKPDYFFTYNNGIATTATNVEVINTIEGIKITKISNFQIINGGQTTASIYYTQFKDKADLSKVFVPMKLTVLNRDDSDDIIENISRYANTQNKVTDADFFSNNPFHILFKDQSNSVLAPAVNGNQRQTYWFYERTKSSYKTSQMKMTKAEKENYETKYPKSQVITKTDLAKYYVTYLGMPHIVAQGSKHYMREFGEYITSERFKPIEEKINEYFFKKSVALAVIFMETDKIVKTQPWYEKGTGYAASIVTYTISKMFDTIDKEYKGKKTLDFNLIWQKQTMYPELRRYLTNLARSVFIYINDDNRGLQNVFHWTRSSDCWDGLKSLPDTLDNEFAKTFILTEEEKDQITKAGKEKKLYNELEALKAVVELGSSYWLKLYEIAKDNFTLNYNEEQDIQKAIKMERTGKYPPSFVAKRLMDFINKCQNYGIDTDTLKTGIMQK